MKRIFCIMIVIIFISSFQMYGHPAFKITGNGVACSFEYNFSQGSPLDSAVRSGIRRGKSFDSAHYQNLYQSPVQNISQVSEVSESSIVWNSIDLSQCSGPLYVQVPGSVPSQSVEVVRKPADCIAKNILMQLRADCLMQRGLPQFQYYTHFLNGQLEAIEKTLNHNVAFQKNYHVSQDMKDFFYERKYDAGILNKPLLGTHVQHYLHEQCLSIFDTVAKTQAESPAHLFQPIYGIVVDLGWSALSYNIAGKIKTASQLVQGCLCLLDCASTVVVLAIGNIAIQAA